MKLLLTVAAIAVLLFGLVAIAWAPPAARVGDEVTGQAICPIVGAVPATGSIERGCDTVLINGKAAARVGDTGSLASQCGAQAFTIVSGSATVLIGGKPAARMNDQAVSTGPGTIIKGSPNVIIGP